MSDQLIGHFDQTIYYYVPTLDEKFQSDTQKIAQQLRKEKINNSIVTSFETKKLNKAIEFANRQWYHYLVILGEQEKQEWIYKIKNLTTGEEEIVNL